MREAKPRDAVALAARMLPQERQDFEAYLALTGDVLGTEAMIERIIGRAAPSAWTATKRGVPLFAFAVERWRYATVNLGYVWLFPTGRVGEQSFKFARNAKPWISAIARRYDALMTFVDCADPKAVRLLSWLSFKTIAVGNPIGDPPRRWRYLMRWS